MGPRAGHSQVPPHPDQIPADHRNTRLNQSAYVDSSDTRDFAGDSSIVDGVTQPNNNVPFQYNSLLRSIRSNAPVFQSNDTPSPLSAGPKQNDTVSKLGNNDARTLPDPAAQTEDNKTHNAGDASRGLLQGSHDSKLNDHPSSTTEHQGEHNGRDPRDASPAKTAYDTKDESRMSKEGSGSHRDTVSDDRRGRYDAYIPPARAGHDSRANGNDSRFPPGERADRERDRDREYDRDRSRDWERDRDRPRDRRSEFFARSYGRSHAPRPPPELRHWEPDYVSDYLPRRYEPRDTDLDRRAGYRNGSHDDRRPPIEDRRPPPVDDRPSRVPLPPSPNDRDLGRPLDDRPIRPLPSARVTEDRTVRPPLSSDDPVGRTGVDERPSRLSTATDDRGSRAPPPAEQRTVRPSVPLEERLQPVPSLQDRLSQPVPPRLDSHVSRQPSLEERLSAAPATSVSTISTTNVPTTVSATVDRALLDDRNTRSATLDPPRTTTLSDRSTDTRPPVSDRFSRPLSPPASRTSAYVPPGRAASVTRDDHRAVPPSSKDILPPVDRSDVRDFRASRDLSRERSAVAYRSEVDRSLDDRNRSAMDVDPPTRFADNRGPPPPRRSPPPGDRARSYYRSPLRDSSDASERRYIPIDRDTLERRRDPHGHSSGAGIDDDKRLRWRPLTDRDRDHRDRFDYGRNERDRERQRDRDEERERDRDREWDRWCPLPPHRSLSSRLTDWYHPPGGADDRTYVPAAVAARDFERSRYPTDDPSSPPFSRVRGRSPSPPPRVGADDLRPPAKRLRDDAPPSYTSGGGSTSTVYGGGSAYSPTRRTSVAIDYAPRSVATPPPSSGASSSFYESRAPPFSGSSMSGDRAYGTAGGAYGSAYDREGRRSPPPSSRMPPPHGRPTYSRGSDPRDDRRYIPPPRTA
ncbi:hypothetical protein ID866_6340 [Astraeus odoratus]|nr:hypothetical protein ID866_6340 [Astraeus odoratus]